jgi:hypothetical protein
MKKLVVLLSLLIFCGCNEDYQEQLNEINSKVDVVQDAAVKSVAAYEDVAKKDEVLGWINAVTVANADSSPINPYAPLIAGVLAVVGGGYTALKKSKEADVAKKKYQAHKSGVESFNLKHPTTAAEMYNTIGEARKNS